MQNIPLTSEEFVWNSMNAEKEENLSVTFNTVEQAIAFYRKTPNRQKSKNLLEQEVSSITHSDRLEAELVYTAIATAINKIISNQIVFYGEDVIKRNVINRIASIDGLAKKYGISNTKVHRVVNDFYDELERVLIAKEVIRPD